MMGRLERMPIRAPQATATPVVSYVRRQDSVATVVETSTKSSPGKQESLTSVVTSTAPAPPPSPAPAPKQKQTAAGPVAGGVVGGVVGLALLLTLAYLLLRRARNRRATRALDSAYAEAGVGGGGVDRRARTRPNQMEETWLPMSHSDLGPAMHESHSAQQSLGRNDAYFASPVHQPFMQDIELGVNPSNSKITHDLPRSESNWTEYQPGPAAQQMRQFQDEGGSLLGQDTDAMPAPAVPVIPAMTSTAAPSSTARDAAPAVAPPTTEVPLASSDVYADGLDRPANLESETQVPSQDTAPAAPAGVAPQPQPSTEAPAPTSTTLGAAPPITGDALGRAPSAAPSRGTLPRLATDSLDYEDTNTELQSPSSAYMWLPSRRFTESESGTVSRADTAASRPHIVRTESTRQDSAEEQEMSNKLWRTMGTLRVANES